MRTSKFRVLRLADGYGEDRWEYLELPRDLQGETWMGQADYNWETWSQYIDLTDKKGVEIYEDDKVAWKGVHATGGQIAGEDVITYDEEQACFKLGNMYFVEDANHYNDLFIDWESLEVVGHARQLWDGK